jgi:hypothetical protein
MTEPTLQTEEHVLDTPNPTAFELKFDAPSIEVDADASTDPLRQRIVTAKMRRPTLEELKVREAKSRMEIVEANATEDSIVSEDERGNAWLFEKIGTEVKGYRISKSEPASKAEEWREATPDLLALLPSSHKAAFVRGMYKNVTAVLVEDEEEGVLLGGGETLPVDLKFGDPDSPFAVVRFEVPAPSETERTDYNQQAIDIRQPKGSRKSRNRIVSNLDVAVKFFDTLMTRPGASIEGDGCRATVQGKTLSETDGMGRLIFLSQIDPMYKRAVVGAALTRYSVKVQD